MVASNPRDDASVVGILSFEAATAMSRLVSLHRSLSDAEVSRLRSDAMRSQGVAYLTSTDQSFLLRLACAELIEELDSTAEAVSRLSRRCRGALPVGFDQFYTDLKSSSIDPTRLGLKFDARSAEKKVKKMDKYVSATEKLFKEMELLGAMEAAERRSCWSRFSGPIPVQKAAPPQQLDIRSQQQKVRRLKEDSLWSQSFDKVVEVMALAAYSICARICVVFGPYVSGLPRVVVYKESSRMGFATPHLRFRVHPRSGPMERRSTAPAAKEVAIRRSCPIPRTTGEEYYNGRNDWSQMLSPPPHTVGGSGLAVRYANVIIQAEKVMMEGEALEKEREELYWQLPAGLKAAVRAKLRECWRRRGPMDGDLASGWKDAVWRILGWLGPVAHDTVRWHGERTVDRTRRLEPQPRMLALQTLQFSDREKTEAAIAEVLVGLSLVCWYDERRRGSLRYC